MGFVVSLTVGAIVIVSALSFLLLRHVERRIESETLFHTLVDSLKEGVLVSDPDGLIVECNVSAVRILGLTREELLGTDQSTIALRPRRRHRDAGRRASGRIGARGRPAAAGPRWWGFAGPTARCAGSW